MKDKIKVVDKNELSTRIFQHHTGSESCKDIYPCFPPGIWPDFIRFYSQISQVLSASRSHILV